LPRKKNIALRRSKMRAAKSLVILLVCCLLAISVLYAGGKKEAGEVREFTLLIRMMDQQDRWFREELVPSFAKEAGAKITVVTFDQFPDIEVMADLEHKSGRHTIGVIKTPMEEVFPMVAKKFMMPLKDIVGEEQLRKDLAEYVDAGVEAGKIEGVQYYIPRKLEANAFFYLKSKVSKAVANWQSMKGDINAMFKAYNGYGLPAGYSLEPDPNEWDWYDLGVVSYYWAHTPGEDGLTMPRMAHRGKDYDGTTSELLTKIYQMGGTEKDVLSMDTDPVIDMFEWEAFYVHNGLYVPAMWEESWSGGGIWKGFAAGRVYAAFMHQIDAFFLHGGTHPDMAGYLVDPNDMATAIMPKGVSLELDSSGRPVREGGHHSNFSGWWWGVPNTSPNPGLSYKLIRLITSYEWHKKESSTFGMMPVRNDIYEDLSKAFPEKWMQGVFNTALAQFKAGTVKAPMVPAWASISQNYRSAWYDVCTGRNYAADPKKGPNRAYIKQALQEYIATTKKLAKQ
jgi:ABC-type glycerol-3-phosphate transport system substrate-binding protein